MKSNRFATLATGIVLLGWIAGMAWRGAAAGEAVHVDHGDAGMVVSESAVASRIGRDTLEQGGSAVDAAIATAFALAVSWPEAGNIGGGGFMIVRPVDGTNPVCIDYRETAPRRIAANPFTSEDSTYSRKAVGVPGTVRGLSTAHDRFGKLAWRDLVMPAARLAEDGVPVTEELAESLNNILARDEVRAGGEFAELRRIYGKAGGMVWQAGDRLVLPDLSKTLSAIAEDGPDVFYRGRIAELMVAEMRRGNGLIELDDLRSYDAKVRPAMQGSFRGYTILGAPPPSSGGTCVIAALNILENFDLASRNRYHARNVHLIAEACRRVFADRARYLGDPEFTDIPEHLTSKAYAKRLAESIRMDAATPSESVAPEIELTSEHPETTHFSVVDSDGMAVSNTYTLEASWGSRIAVRGAGFVLNNQMGDFNWFPGVTNRQGRIGTAANLVEPGKRMLSSQSPTMVEKNGRLLLVTGSPGGRTIINTVLCIVLGVTEFDMEPVDAVAAPRMHHQWFPDRILLERSESPPHSMIIDPLRALGHRVEHQSRQGSAHTIAIDPVTGGLTGIADFRRGGRPAGVASRVIARWDFADDAHVGLERARSSTRWDARWSSGIADSYVDGRDHFRIRRDAPAKPFDAHVDLLKSHSASPIFVDMKIAAARFAGLKKNEQLRLGFTHDTEKPHVTARLVFGRNGQNKITLRGEALGKGTPIPPVILADANQIDRPIIVRLELDTGSDEYRIASRWASESRFTYHGIGKVAADRMANHLRLSVLNDFAAEGEFVDIDRIELHAGDPRDEGATDD